MADSVSYTTIGALLLDKLDAPQTPEMSAAAGSWFRHESGGQIIGNNPANIHYDVARSYGIQPAGKWYSSSDGAYVAKFATLDDGVAATATILNRNIHGYKQASDAARRNDPVGFLNALAASDWSTSHYGATVNVATHTITGGHNSLLDGIKGSASNAVAVVASRVDGKWYHLIENLLLNNDKGWKTWSDALANSPFFGDLTVGKNVSGDLRSGQINSAGAVYSSSNADTQSVLDALKALNIDPNTPMSATDVAKVEDWLNTQKRGTSITGGGKTTTEVAGDAANNALGGLALPGFLKEPANWLYILALGVGIGLTGYGIIVLVHAYGAQPSGVTP